MSPLRRGELVGCRDLFDDAVNSGLVPTALAQLVHAAAQVGRFASDGEHIGAPLCSTSSIL